MSRIIDTYTRTFTNSADARRFTRSIGGPIQIEVTNPKRGEWIVTVHVMDFTKE